MTDGPLFAYAASAYPESPGCLKVLRQATGPMTADEVAAELGKSVLSIRPRITELGEMGLIRDSGSRGENKSMKAAIKWSANGGEGGRLDSGQESVDSGPC